MQLSHLGVLLLHPRPGLVKLVRHLGLLVSGQRGALAAGLEGLDGLLRAELSLGHGHQSNALSPVALPVVTVDGDGWVKRRFKAGLNETNDTFKSTNAVDVPWLASFRAGT